MTVADSQDASGAAVGFQAQSLEALYQRLASFVDFHAAYSALRAWKPLVGFDLPDAPAATGAGHAAIRSRLPCDHEPQAWHLSDCTRVVLVIFQPCEVMCSLPQ